MTDKVSTFKIGVEGDAGDIPAFLQALKTQFQSAVRDIQTLTSKLNLFDSVQQDSQRAATALSAAKDAVAQLQAQIAKVQSGGGAIGDDLAASLKKAEAAAASAQKQYTSYQTQLGKLSTTLKAAGVDTDNVSAAQAKLAALLTATTAAAAQQSAKDLLGFKSLDDVAPKIAALTSAFQVLKDSGKLSAAEIGIAEEKLQAQIAAVKAEVSTVPAGFESFKGSFAAVSASVLGVVTVVQQVTSHFTEALQQAREYQQGIAQVGAQSTLSAQQLNDLGEQVRKLARDTGVDLNDALTQLQVLLHAGLPADNAITALTAATDAARISQSSLSDTTKLTTTLINGFGVDTKDVGRVLDVFVQSAKNGGASLTELASSLGPLGPVAQATGTSIDDLGAALEIMIKAGVPAGQAVTDLGHVLDKLSTTTAQKALQDVGVSATGLIGTLQQLGSKGLDGTQLLGLGVASERSAAGIIALTSRASELNTILIRQKSAAEDAAKALELLEKTPKDAIDKASAAERDFNINLATSSEAITQINRVIAVMLNAFNDLNPKQRDFALATATVTPYLQALGPLGVSVAAGFERLALSLGGAKTQAIGFGQAAQAVKTAVDGIQKALDAQKAALNSQLATDRAGLQGFVDDLQKVVTATQAATQSSVNDVTTRAQLEIAALDQSTAAQQATATATLAIQQKAAADKLEILNQGVIDAAAAADREAQARIAAARAAGQTEQQINQTVGLQIQQDRLAQLGFYLGQYQSLYSTLLGQEKSFVDKLNSIDQERVSFNQDIQTRLTAIRSEGLSDFDVYLQKSAQINQLLAQAQQSFQEGGQAGVDAGKRYISQILSISDSLKTVVNSDGVAVISAFDLQQQKLKTLDQVSDLYNASLDKQDQFALEGKNATLDSINAITPKLATLQSQYDTLSINVKEGLAVRLTVDDAKIAEIGAKIDAELAKQRTLKNITVDVQSITKQIDDVVNQIKTGTTEDVDTKLDQIDANLKKVAAEDPQLQVSTDDAQNKLKTLAELVTKSGGDIKAKLTIDSNAPDVQKAVDNLKLPTESTHVVHIKYDDPGNPSGGAPGAGLAPVLDPGLPAVEDPGLPRFARGGSVGTAISQVQHFARGGGVKVPGTGNSDTVPAVLQSGSYVIRKSASSFYGDGIMSRLAGGAAMLKFMTGGGFTDPPRLAGGGFGMSDRGLGITDPKKLSTLEQFVADVAAATHDTGSGPTAPVIDPKKGYQPGDSFQSNLPPISFDTRPVPASLITAGNVLAYAREVFNQVGPNNPLLGVLATEIPDLIRKVDSDPTDTASITALLQAAETIGANPVLFSMWGKTASSANPPPAEWFYDYLAKTEAGALNAALAGGDTGGGSIAPAPSGSVPALHPETAQRILTGTNDFAQRFFSSPAFGNAFYKENPLAQINKEGPLAHIDLFADGGAAPRGGDTVPAMLTPGEFVVRPERAAALGGSFLNAVNSMHISREDLGALLNPGSIRIPRSRSPISYFAEGGAVGKIPETAAMQNGGGATGGINGDINVNVTAPVQTLFSEANVRRYLLPVLNDLLRRSPTK